jgi:protein-S-isoprenylcysteine O-methyltransferase Ste14
MRSVIGWLLVLAQFALLALFAFTGWALHPWPFVIVGLTALFAAIALGIRAFGALGSALTPTPVPIYGAGLRTDGVYAWIRHPIYSAILLGLLGLLIAAGSLRGWILWLVMCVFFLFKSRWEDSLLAHVYGAEWELWSSRTGALIPKARPPR